MRLLIIGQPDSGHTISFLHMIRQVYLDELIHFFPSSPFRLHPTIESLCDHCYEYSNPRLKDVYYQAYWDDLAAKPLSIYSGEPKQLLDVITEYQPDFVHVNAMQDAGYLLSKAFALGLKKRFKLIYSIWGVDIHSFKNNPAHHEEIKKFLGYVDLIVPESSRELSLAISMGYKGKFTDLIEATLVTREKLLSRLPQTMPPKENLIVVKQAYQSFRSNNGVFLRGVANCLEILQDWSLVYINPSLEDYKHLREIASFGKNFKIAVYNSYIPHPLFLELLSRAKYLAAVNLSDGVPNTFLECCASMTYPILSVRASMEDWQSPEHNNVIQLDPYDIVDATKSLRGLFSDNARWEASVSYNKIQLERYSEDKVSKIVQQFYQ